MSLERSVLTRQRRCRRCKPAGRTGGATQTSRLARPPPPQARLIYLAGVLLFEDGRLLEEEPQGVGQRRSRSGPAVPSRVHELPAGKAEAASAETSVKAEVSEKPGLVAPASC